MGNNPSTPTAKPATSTTTPGSASPQETHGGGAGSGPGGSGSSLSSSSRLPGKRDSRSIIPMHTTQRSPAPPEESHAQATRTSVVNHSSARSLQQAGSSMVGSASSVGTGSGGIGPQAGLGSGASSFPAGQQQQAKQPQEGGSSKGIDVWQERSKPVAVPIESSSTRSAAALAMAMGGVGEDESGQLLSQSSITDMSYLRAPRMPLPIEEEVHTPGSPIIAPTEQSDAPDDVDALDSDHMTRKSSGFSNVTIDEEEADELIIDKSQPSVSTRLEWRRGGEKVYVTGSIFQWNKKHRLHPVDGQSGVFACSLPIHPGIHHVRFLVDGIMQTSPDLPTTVDFGNNLVNYIEVSPDDVLPPKPGEPPVAPKRAEREKSSAPAKPQQAETAVPAKEQKLVRGRSVLPAETYLQHIPPYLVDFDQSEDSPAYQYAVTAIEKLPTPPGLPQFLSKPILNVTASIKDDNSVLIMPNHTVLNHLGTSSIKDNVLALSATTRYKHKYVTTIIYKPASNDE